MKWKNGQNMRIKICPDCNGKVRADDTFCNLCGKKFDAVYKDKCFWVSGGCYRVSKKVSV